MFSVLRLNNRAPHTSHIAHLASSLYYKLIRLVRTRDAELDSWRAARLRNQFTITILPLGGCLFFIWYADLRFHASSALLLDDDAHPSYYARGGGRDNHHRDEPRVGSAAQAVQPGYALPGRGARDGGYDEPRDGGRDECHGLPNKEETPAQW